MSCIPLRPVVAFASLALSCALLSTPARTAEIINTGMVVEIGIPKVDIEVFDSGDPAPTTVNLVAGGQIGYALNGDGTIMMEDDGEGGMQPVLSNEDQSVGLFDNSVFNMTGGDTASSVLVSDMAEASIEGGTIGGDLIVEGNGKAFVTGPEPPEGEDPETLVAGACPSKTMAWQR